MKICKFLAIGTIWGQEPGPVVDFGTESELGQRTRERHLDQNGFLIPRGLFKSDVDLLDEENVSLDEIARGRGRNDGELGEKGKQRVEEKVLIIIIKKSQIQKFNRPKRRYYLNFILYRLLVSLNDCSKLTIDHFDPIDAAGLTRLANKP